MSKEREVGVKRKGKRSEWQGQDRDGVVWILTVEYYVKGTRAHKLFSTIFQFPQPRNVERHIGFALVLTPHP